MRRSVVLIAAWLISLQCAGRAAAAEQCLSPEELANAARMASVMSIGAALKRCGACLGGEYPQVVQRYDAAGLMDDFVSAQKQIKGQAKIDFADDIVREAARIRTAALSADCDACRRTAETIDALSQADARRKLYESGQNELTKMKDFRGCP